MSIGTAHLVLLFWFFQLLRHFAFRFWLWLTFSGRLELVHKRFLEVDNCSRNALWRQLESGCYLLYCGLLISSKAVVLSFLYSDSLGRFPAIRCTSRTASFPTELLMMALDESMKKKSNCRNDGINIDIYRTEKWGIGIASWDWRLIERSIDGTYHIVESFAFRDKASAMCLMRWRPSTPSDRHLGSQCNCDAGSVK